MTRSYIVMGSWGPLGVDEVIARQFIATGIGLDDSTPAVVIGRRRRARKSKSHLWTDQDTIPGAAGPTPAPFDPGLSLAAIAAIQARLDAMSALEAKLAAAGTANAALGIELRAELDRLKAIEDDEDDIETLLLS